MDGSKLFFYRILLSALGFYKSISSRLKNFVMIYLSWLYMPFKSKKNKIIALIVAALFVAGIALYISFKGPIPPNEIVFFNKAVGEELEGDVYIDGELIGDTSGTLQEIPSIYCKGTHEIMLKTDKYTLNWESKPSDCELKRVVYTASIREDAGEEAVSMKFMVKETGELLKGDVAFDDVIYGYADSAIQIPVNACEAVSSIKLYLDGFDANATAEQRFVEWAHDPSWCRKYDPIVYSVSGGEVDN